MKKCSELFENKIANLKVLIPLLGLLVLAFGYSNVIDLVVFGVIVFVSVFLPLEKTFLLLIFTTIFDDVLVLDFLAGSILRIVMVICIARLFLFFVQNRINPVNKKNGLVWICVIFFFGVGLITNGISSQSLMICVNIGLLLFWGVYYRKYQQDKLVDIYKEIVYVLVSAVLFSCVYGVIHFNFLIETSHGYQIARFNGVFEPNFMCTYLNIGLASTFLNEEYFSKRWWMALTLVFTVFACLTVSISGLALLSIIYLYYIFAKKKDIWKRIRFVICMFLLSVISFVGINKAIRVTIEYVNSKIAVENPVEETDSPNAQENLNTTISQDMLSDDNVNTQEIVVSEGNPLVVRLKSLVIDIKNGNFDVLTSGRTALIREFFTAAKQRTGIESLFGNGLETKMIHSDFFGKEKYSHNTYIDLLYNFGWIGSVIVFGFIANRVYSGIFLGILDPVIRKKITVLRLCCLFAALTLSIYSRRLFLLFFIL